MHYVQQEGNKIFHCTLDLVKNKANHLQFILSNLSNYKYENNDSNNLK